MIFILSCPLFLQWIEESRSGNWYERSTSIFTLFSVFWLHPQLTGDPNWWKTNINSTCKIIRLNSTQFLLLHTFLCACSHYQVKILRRCWNHAIVEQISIITSAFHSSLNYLLKGRGQYSTITRFFALAVGFFGNSYYRLRIYRLFHFKKQKKYKCNSQWHTVPEQ